MPYRDCVTSIHTPLMCIGQIGRLWHGNIASGQVLELGGYSRCIESWQAGFSKSKLWTTHPLPFSTTTSVVLEEQQPCSPGYHSQDPAQQWYKGCFHHTAFTSLHVLTPISFESNTVPSIFNKELFYPCIYSFIQLTFCAPPSVASRDRKMTRLWLQSLGSLYKYGGRQPVTHHDKCAHREINKAWEGWTTNDPTVTQKAQRLASMTPLSCLPYPPNPENMLLFLRISQHWQLCQGWWQSTEVLKYAALLSPSSP